MIRKDKIVSDTSLHFDEVVPGRIASINISYNGQSSKYWNVHNFGLTPRDFDKAMTQIRHDLALASSDPQHNSLWLIGDFNREPNDVPRRNLKDPLLTTYPSVGANSSNNFAYGWDALFNDLIEITNHEPTHYISESMTLNKIDRIFTSIPSHAWLTTAPILQNIIRPELAHARGLSDHAIMQVDVSLRAKPDPANMPIRRECFEHPRFKERLNATLKQVDLDSLPTWERWETHKIILRDAALHARDHMLSSQEDSDFSIQGTISSIARAIWSGNVKLMRIILARSAFARKHLHIHDDEIQIFDAVEFDREVAEVRHKFLAAAAENMEATIQHPRTRAKKRKKTLSKLDANRRLAKLWLPQQKRLVLHAITIKEEDGNVAIVEDGLAIANGLAAAWKPIFEKKPIPIEEAKRYLDKHGKQWDWSLAATPIYEMCKMFSAHCPTLECHIYIYIWHVQSRRSDSTSTAQKLRWAIHQSQEKCNERVRMSDVKCQSL